MSHLNYRLKDGFACFPGCAFPWPGAVSAPSPVSFSMNGAEHEPRSQYMAWGDPSVGVQQEVPVLGDQSNRAPGPGYRGAVGGRTPAEKGCGPARVPVQGWAVGPERGGRTHVSLTSRRVPEQPGATSPVATAAAHPPLPGTGTSGKW